MSPMVRIYWHNRMNGMWAGKSCTVATPSFFPGRAEVPVNFLMAKRRSTELIAFVSLQRAPV